MGWNSWNAYKKNIDEPLFIESAEALIRSGLADAGYVHINVDDGWSGDDANAENSKLFPKGIGALADYMHQRKLKLGLYTNWKSIGKEERDAKQWAAWKIDLIKNDAWKTPSSDPYWMKMRNAITATGWPMVHSVHFSDEDFNPPNIHEMANMWRITNDIQNYYNHASIPGDKKDWAYSTLDIVDRMAEVAHLIKPGCWADEDMQGQLARNVRNVVQNGRVFCWSFCRNVAAFRHHESFLCGLRKARSILSWARIRPRISEDRGRFAAL